MKSFIHINARTVDEAVTALKAFDGKAVLNAGGTDLLGILKSRALPRYPEAIINIKTIAGLDDIVEDSEGLRIGALAQLSSIVAARVIRSDYVVLAEAARAVATPQIRNMGTLGGNLCQDVRCWYYRYPHQIGGRILCLRKSSRSCPAVGGDNRYHAIMGGSKGCFAVCPSDTAIALTALDASVSIVSPRAVRSVPVRDFYTGLGNVLQPDEMVTEISIPRPPKASKQTFLKLTVRKPIDFAIVSVASVIAMEHGVCQHARIAMGAIAPTPIRALTAEEVIQGKPIDDITASEAAESALAGAKSLRMNAHKVEQAKVLLRRAIVS